MPRFCSAAVRLVLPCCIALGQVGCGRGDNPPATEGVGALDGAAAAGGVGSADGTGGSSAQLGGSAGRAPAGGSGPVGVAGTLGLGGGAAGPSLPLWPDGRGPSVPFTVYEAEAEGMRTNGTPTVTTRALGRISGESSGRRAVVLAQPGQFLEFENRASSNSIVVRYSIPDNGLDYRATLSVLVDGESRGKLNLTSRYSWSYGGDDVFNQPGQKDRSLGKAHHFYDEAHALLGDVPIGAKVMLRKEADDTAADYTIDLVELEQVGPALPQPNNFVSISECGAVANDPGDDSSAIQQCADRAQAEGRGLYIPAGAFQSRAEPLSVAGLTVRGAGMWHSSINGKQAQFACWGAGNCKFYDFALFGDTVLRDDEALETAFHGNGSGGVVENIWVEHFKVGAWMDKGTRGFTIRGSRFRNLHADGVNFYGGHVDCVVENSHFRNTGDDALAIWSHSFESPGPSTGNTFRKNYIQVPWKANCFGVYGGQDNLIEDNVCADVVQYPGVLFARQFDVFPFTGMTRLNRNTLLRAGGSAYNHTHGALKFHADQGPVQNISVTELDIIDPTYSGVHVQGEGVIDRVWLNGVSLQNPGNASFFLNAGSKGALDAVGVVVTGGTPGVINESDGQFNLIRGPGSSGF